MASPQEFLADSWHKVYTLIFLFWLRLRDLCWRLTGTAAKLEEITNGPQGPDLAQVLYIWYTNIDGLFAKPDTFLATHDSFVPATTILQKNVTLLGIMKTTAVFLQIKSDLDITDTRQYPFFCDAQTKHAQKIIVVRLDVFRRVMEKVDISDRPVVWLFHTGRCGSTAWVQAFNALSDWTVYSEPQANRYYLLYGQSAVNLQEMSKTKEYAKNTIAIVRYHIHQAPNRSVVWKSVAADIHMMPVIANYFPQHKILLTYRDALPSTKSLYTSFGGVSRLRRAAETLQENPFSTMAGEASGLARVEYSNGIATDTIFKLFRKVLPANLFECFLLHWATVVLIVKQTMRSGIEIKPIKYDSFIADKRRVVREVFQYLGISTDSLNIALQALDEDSQAGTPYSKTRRSKDRVWNRTEESVRRCNMILKELGLPDLDSSLVLDGTI